MGNVKSRTKNSTKIRGEISRNLIDSSPLLTKTSENQINPKKDNKIKVGGRTTAITTTSTTAAFSVGSPLLVEVKNTDTKKNTSKSNKAFKDSQQTQEQFNHKQRQQKAADNSAAAEAAEQPHLKQGTSFWSLGSLKWNLSYSGRNSYKQRQKSFKKEKDYSTLQYQRKRSKTQWHKPLTNAIFHSHFKESSRNEEFYIDQLVAKGAFGVVFKVIDKKSTKEADQKQQHQQQQDDQLIRSAKTSVCHPPVYALKVLKKSKIISENSLQQIKDEVDIQKICGHHPFIVKQFDLWQNRYNLHILSEYVPNGELFSTIRKFSLNLIRLYLAEIALGLDFLHNAGIIYRDAKPENILLTHDFHLKLTDFGLSKWLKLGSTTKTMCGTFQYMAPEILRGEAYTHAVDWWSLGIIVCQMFVEKSPDIRKFITINLSQDSLNNVIGPRTRNYSKESLSATETELPDDDNFLPSEVESLCHEAEDVLKRLLEFDAQKRLRSVRALQKIAMYKDFKIESHYCLKIRPLDIIENDNIIIERSPASIVNSSSASEAFKIF